MFLKLIIFSVLLLFSEVKTGCINSKEQCARNNSTECKSSDTASLDENMKTFLKSTTLDGLLCQTWSSQKPNEHKWSELGDNSYCQNPDKGPGPWCYVKDEKIRWKLCYYACNEERTCINSKHQCASNYMTACMSSVTAILDENKKTAVKSTTVDGLKCQKWSSQTPHKHKWYELGDNNHCQNPDQEPGPWCYTEDEKIRWKLCYPTCNKKEEEENYKKKFKCPASDSTLNEKRSHNDEWQYDGETYKCSITGPNGGWTVYPTKWGK